MRIYNRALSATEIQTDMSTPVAPPPEDTTAPVVAISSPVSGTTVSGTVNVTATASDDVGLVSVQFLLNSMNFGAAVTAAPYAIAWNTQSIANGPYTLTAIARDFAGNASVSRDVTVTVSNTSVSVIGGTVCAVHVSRPRGDAAGRARHGQRIHTPSLAARREYVIRNSFRDIEPWQAGIDDDFDHHRPAGVLWHAAERTGVLHDGNRCGTLWLGPKRAVEQLHDAVICASGEPARRISAPAAENAGARPRRVDGD